MDENNPIIRKKDYILLKDFKVKTEVDEKGFILCFWVSIFNFYSVYPKTILEQVYAEINSRSPLLVLNGKTLMLLPLTYLLNEAPGPGNTDLRLTAEIEQNQNKWIHVGYEVSSDFVRLCVNGEIAGERHLSCSSRKRTLIDIRGDRSFHAFIHEAKVLPSTFSIKDQYVKDFEVQRKITGCEDYMTQENFEKMWCWLYPVAFTLSSDRIKAMWNSTSPKWIEGFITKEEAELSLQGPSGLREPGTFILRFPISRSWPHLDAGSLVVTYVGSDYALHHLLLSIDNVYSSGALEMNVEVKPLHDVLLEEPELSCLGRVVRCH